MEAVRRGRLSNSGARLSARDAHESSADGIRRVFRLPWRRGVHRDVEDEFAFHLAERARELEARGYSPAAARDEALRQFGDFDDALIYCRDIDARRERGAMRIEWMSEIRQDVSFAWRTLMRAPGFALVAILTLALGIGANTAIFSVVNGILLRPLPFHEPDRLVMVAQATAEHPRTTNSPANVMDWRTMNASFSGMAAWLSSSRNLTARGLDAERLEAAEVQTELFEILGVRPLAGRGFRPEEAEFNAEKVVLLGEPIWRSRYGSDPRVVGTTMVLDGVAHTVVGIIPEKQAYPRGAQIWLPLRFDPEWLPKSRGAIYLRTVARLKPGVSLQQADAEMKAIAGRLEREYPESNAKYTAVVIPMHEWIVGDLRKPLLVLLGAVGLVLLIACTNVSNLMLVRASGRETEIAVRTALGAGRGRLVRQLVTESAVLSIIGGLAGVLLAVWGVRALVRIAPEDIPRLDAVRVDPTVLFFATLAALLTGVVFGLIPALHAARPDIGSALKEGARGSGARPASRRLRNTLVVSEIALAVMLLAGAGLLIRSFRELVQVDPGFRAENVMTFTLSLPEEKYEELSSQSLFIDQLVERLRAVPGVKATAASIGLPLTGFSFSFSFEIAGKPKPPDGEEPSAQVRLVTPDYFRTMEIPTIRGRTFTPADRWGSQQVLVATESAARRFFPGEDPIGKRITFGWGRDSLRLGGEIVGIIGDVRQSELSKAALPEIYAPFAQWPVDFISVVMRTTGEPNAVVNGARNALRELDADLPMYNVRTLEAVVSESVARPRFYMLLLTSFAAVALLLSAIGIYGVIAYLVSMRTRELGIRIALGASNGDVLRLVLREGVVMASAGLVVGTIGALALSRLLSGLLFGVAPTDPLTFALVAATLAAVALAASFIPARRASRLDPLVAIRAE
ncbi:MAG TPA: ABC transporter permease [Gemmatimonadaceae bacterium]|nr:ABC transporter permease [Gemmatimonadaceae bacterium]